MKAWEDFLKKQEELLGKPIVEKWLRPLRVAHFDSGNLYLEAKDSFVVIWFEEHIRPLLKKHLLNNNFRPIRVHLTAMQEAGTPPEKKQKGKINDLPKLQLIPDSLDPAATFEHFIPGKSSQVIFKFFCQLSGYNPITQELEPPTLALGTFNPIYLWGGAGSGKTHLLMALAHAFKKRGLTALYAKTETFTEHVVAAIRSSEMQIFRKAYRHVDVILIDNVHQLSRKSATQEEFFHTFNALHMAGKQIILSANCSPTQLVEIEPRLVSRFEWGINLHFETAQAEELKSILDQRCEAMHFPLSEEVKHFLLKNFHSSTSISQALEALILRSYMEEDARYQRNPSILTVGKVEHMLSDLLLQESSRAISAEKIIAEVSAHYGIRMEELLGKSQSQECSFPRQVAMHLCRQELKMPYAKIGRLFGRDHSTVMTSIRQIEKRIEEKNSEILASLSEIFQNIEKE